MEFAEILEVRALLKLGDGSRDLIDAALRHALCLLQIVEILALDSLVLGVVLTHGFPAPWPSDHSERVWWYLLVRRAQKLERPAPSRRPRRTCRDQARAEAIIA